jgi:hypothetical protein
MTPPHQILGYPPTSAVHPKRDPAEPPFSSVDTSVLPTILSLGRHPGKSQCDTGKDMGKQSRAKRNRIPAPVPRFSLRSFSLDWSTWMFVNGILVLSYGTQLYSTVAGITPRMLTSIPFSIRGLLLLGSH